MACKARCCRVRSSPRPACQAFTRRQLRCCRRSRDGSVHRDVVGRYYDPATGQFLSVDAKVQQTLEAYLYAGDDPVNGSDPNGMFNVGFSKCGQYLPGGPTKCGTSNPFGWVVDAARSVGHFVASHKVAVGVAFGVIVVATGGAAFFAEGALATTILSATGVAAGTVSSSIDTGPCLHHDAAACAGAILGWSATLASSGTAAGMAFGIEKTSTSGYLLYGALPGLSLNAGAAALTVDSTMWLASEINSRRNNRR